MACHIFDAMPMFEMHCWVEPVKKLQEIAHLHVYIHGNTFEHVVHKILFRVGSKGFLPRGLRGIGGIVVIHYGDVIMGTIASQIANLAIVYSTVYSGADQRKHQSSASLAFVRGPVNSPHKWPVTRRMFPFNDVIMIHIPVTFIVLALHHTCKLWRFGLFKYVHIGSFNELINQSFLCSLKKSKP